MKKHSLKIEPAIVIDHRHKISELLGTLGYDVMGSGQFMDGSSCDISFYDKTCINCFKDRYKTESKDINGIFVVCEVCPSCGYSIMTQDQANQFDKKRQRMICPAQTASPNLR
jgi:hypothetical protein